MNAAALCSPRRRDTLGRSMSALTAAGPTGSSKTSAVAGKELTIPTPPTFENLDDERYDRKVRLAAAFRMFSRAGLDEGVAGHITVRDPAEPDSYWVNPSG
jgi:hypothetical protein